MAKALELNERIDPEYQQFKASSEWLKNCQSCHNICHFAISEDMMSADMV